MPILVKADEQIDYVDLAQYALSYPDKVAKLFADRLIDDDMKFFTKDFYDLACEADADGPDFRVWREI